MMSVLEDLWLGNITPSERGVKKNSEYDKLAKESLKQEEKFIQELSADGRQAYGDRLFGNA